MTRVRNAWLALIAGLAGLLIFYLVSDVICLSARCGEQGYRRINMIGLSFLLLSCVSVILCALRRDAVLLWTPLVIYPLSVALYFAFGNMFFIFGDPGFLSGFFRHRYSVTQPELLRANILTTVGVLTVSISMLVFHRLRVTRQSEVKLFAKPRPSLATTATILLVGGLGVEAAEILLRLLQGATARLPGLIQNLTVMTALGLAVALYLGNKGHRGWYLVFWVIWVPYVGYSSLEFSKLGLIVAIVLPAAGAYLGHGSILRILPFVLLAAVSFAGVQDLNSESRIALRAEIENGQAPSLADRARILIDTFESQRQYASTMSVEAVSQVWWQRLSYAGPQVRAMELYDAGQATTWQVNPLVYFIPRAVWPNKPEMPALGREFNWEVLGNEYMSTRVGITIYANGYWMMGWFGVILFSAVYGLILATITRVNLAIIENRNLIFFPAVFLGISISSQSQMGFFETSLLGGVPIYIGLLVVIRYGLMFGRGRSF